MRRARSGFGVGLVVVILVPAGVARGQPGLRVPFIPPPPRPIVTPPILVPPPIVPPRPVPIWPQRAAAPAPLAAAPAPAVAPAPAPDFARLRWLITLAVVSAAIGGASSVLMVQSLMKLYRARHRRVRIVATPSGEAPLDVRGAWVGLTLPLVPHAPAPYTTAVIEAVSGHDAPPVTGYVVNGKQAVDRLDHTAPWAAAWWREHAPHVLVDNFQFLFPADVCEVL